LEIPLDCVVRLPFTNDSRQLAAAYLGEKILGPASLNDAYHIAIATVGDIRLLVSRNFRHIVNLDKIRLFNAINLKSGYPEMDIRSTKELLKYED